MPKIAFRAPLLEVSGYGYASRYLATLLPQIGDLYLINNTYKYTHKPSELLKEYNIRNKIYSKIPDNIDIFIDMTTGDQFERHGRVNVGLTMYELNGIPQSWIDPMKNMDMIWTCSEYNINKFKEYTNSVYKIGLGNIQYTKDELTPIIDQMISKYNIDMNKLIILSVSDYNPRKGIHQIRYMMDLVDDSTQYIVKINAYHGSNELRFLKQYLKMNKKDNVILIDEYLTNKELAALYSISQYFLFPSRGEGFGLPVLDAMRYNSVPIMPIHTALHEFVTDNITNIIKLNYSEEIINKNRNEKWRVISNIEINKAYEIIKNISEDKRILIVAESVPILRKYTEDAIVKQLKSLIEMHLL